MDNNYNSFRMKQKFKNNFQFKIRKFSEDRALDHFDKAYSLIYGKKWNSIRAALLTKHKSVALVNNFADPVKTSQELELSGAINLKSLVEQKHPIVPEDELNFTNKDSSEEFIQGTSFQLFLCFMNIIVSISSLLTRYEQMVEVEQIRLSQILKRFGCSYKHCTRT